MIRQIQESLNIYFTLKLNGLTVVEMFNGYLGYGIQSQTFMQFHKFGLKMAVNYELSLLLLSRFAKKVCLRSRFVLPVALFMFIRNHLCVLNVS